MANNYQLGLINLPWVHLLCYNWLLLYSHWWNSRFNLVNLSLRCFYVRHVWNMNQRHGLRFLLSPTSLQRRTAHVSFVKNLRKQSWWLVEVQLVFLQKISDFLTNPLIVSANTSLKTLYINQFTFQLTFSCELWTADEEKPGKAGMD